MYMYLTKEFENSFGVDELDLMVQFMKVLHIDRGYEPAFNNFKSYLASQIKRGITPEEELRLCEGILSYVMAEPASNERDQAMKHLFTLSFLNQ